MSKIILVLMIVIIFIITVEYCAKNTQMNGTKHGGLTTFDLSGFGKCVIENRYLNKVHNFAFNHLSNLPKLGCYYDKSEKIAAIELYRDEYIQIHLNMYFEGEYEDFAGIFDGSHDDAFYLFFTGIEDVIELTPQEKYPLVVKYNREVYEANKKFIAEHEDLARNRTTHISVMKNSKNVLEIYPSNMEEVVELPAPTVGFENLTGSECFFNTALEFLLRMGPVSYTEHPDLIWLRWARRFYLQDNIFPNFEETQINNLFETKNITKYEYIEKIITHPFTIKYLDRGAANTGFTLNNEGDPYDIIVDVLIIAQSEYTANYIEETSIDICSICGGVINTLNIGDTPILQLNVPDPTLVEHKVEDFVQHFNSGAENSANRDYCAVCKSTNLVQVKTDIVNLSDLKYIPIRVALINSVPKMRVKLRQLENVTIGTYKFNTVAIIAHQGASYVSGHNLIFVNKYGKWYYLDDSRCTEITTNIYNELDRYDSVLFLLERQ